jgi:uncharacterized protein (DUF2384 family)
VNQHESERMLRLAEIYEAAVYLFDGDKADAREWLLSPFRAWSFRKRETISLTLVTQISNVFKSEIGCLATSILALWRPDKGRARNRR